MGCLARIVGLFLQELTSVEPLMAGEEKVSWSPGARGPELVMVSDGLAIV